MIAEKHKERIAELLIESGAYTDKETPVIINSGLLSNFFINGEKLLFDGGAWENIPVQTDDGRTYGQRLIGHAVSQAAQEPRFREVVDMLAETCDRFLTTPTDEAAPFISGGERRDLIFSGAVAHTLGESHVTLYKNPTKVAEVMSPSGELCNYTTPILPHGVHIVDMLTTGSSVTAPEKGWIAQLESYGLNMRHLIAGVSRGQGGPENLLEKQVQAHVFAEIGPDFLHAHSSQPEEVIAYLRNEVEWCKNYMKDHGTEFLVDYFAPDHAKPEKGINFLNKLGDALKEINKYEELREAVQERYQRDINDIC